MSKLIEEAALKYANKHKDYNCAGLIFYDGAKSEAAKEYWQQGMYTEEEVLKIIDNLFHKYASSYRHDAKVDFINKEY